MIQSRQRTSRTATRLFASPDLRRAGVAMVIACLMLGVAPVGAVAPTVEPAQTITKVVATPVVVRAVDAPTKEPAAPALTATPHVATATPVATPVPTPSPTPQTMVTTTPKPAVTSPTPAVSATPTALTTATGSTTTSTVASTPTGSATPRGSAIPNGSVTPAASAKPTGSATPAGSATPNTQAVKIVTPTNISATVPPPSVPTLDLSGLKILDNPGIGGNALIARAALRHYGEFYRPDGVPWVGWCEMFAGDVLAEAGVAHARYASAIDDAIAAPLYRGAAPAGSLVFFDQRSSPYGHVGVSLGDGTMLSALGGGVVRTSYQDWLSYLGWRPYGTTAPTDPSFTLRAYETATFTDDPSLAWGASGAAAPSDASSDLAERADQAANDLPARLVPILGADWNAPPPYRSPRQAMK